MYEIIFAGGSHYGLGGYKSLWKYFDKVYLISDISEEIRTCIRKNDEVITDFETVDCKYVFLCGYSKFITKNQLEKKTYINVHGALLPKYRGMHGTFYAIMNDEKEMGITFHLVDQFMDAGDILEKYSFKYLGQTVQEINDTIDKLIYDYAGDVIYRFINDKITPIPQNDDEAIYGAKRNLKDCLIDFHMPNMMLRRFFRALTPNYPYPMLMIRGEQYEVLPVVEIIDKRYYGPTGRVVFVNEKGTWVKIEEGFLIVNKVRKFGVDTEENLSDLVPIGYRFS